MSELYNIYCDESCHLEHDQQKVMLFGAVWCTKAVAAKVGQDIATLGAKFRARGELKWNKVSQSRKDFYLALLDYYVQTRGLNFRCLVVDDKTKLNHEYFNQGSHDTFYYKMYYYLLLNIIAPNGQYRVFLDEKDTWTGRRAEVLKQVLRSKLRDPDGKVLLGVQPIKSHESRLVQLADFLTGTVGYRYKSTGRVSTKLEIAAKLSSLVHSDFIRNTPPWSEKFNLFVFSPTEVGK